MASSSKMWCLGSRISLRYASFIIAMFQLIALFFFVMNLPELWLKDGFLFYTDAVGFTS